VVKTILGQPAVKAYQRCQRFSALYPLLQKHFHAL